MSVRYWNRVLPCIRILCKCVAYANRLATSQTDVIFHPEEKKVWISFVFRNDIQMVAKWMGKLNWIAAQIDENFTHIHRFSWRLIKNERNKKWVAWHILNLVVVVSKFRGIHSFKALCWRSFTGFFFFCYAKIYYRKYLKTALLFFWHPHF